MIVDHRSFPWTTGTFDLHWNLTGPIRDLLFIDRIAYCDCEECAKTFKKEVYMETLMGKYEHINPKETEELTDHHYLLMPSHMFVFVLKDRTYGASYLYMD